MSDLVYKELSYIIVGCAQRVHTALGPGFPEKVYQRAMCHELTKSGLPFREQAEFAVTYDGCLCGEFQSDIFVDEKVILELKAVDSLIPQHEAQVLAYLKASGARLALLMNFGEPRLAVKRFVH